MFNALYAAMSEAHAILTIDGVSIERCLCSGIGQARANSEQGMFAATTDTVRFLATDAATAGLTDLFTLDRVVTLSVNGGADMTLRITAIRSIGGVVALTLGAENE